MRYAPLVLALLACTPAEVPVPDAGPRDAPAEAASCSPACAAGQVCVGGACFAPVDAGPDAAPPDVALDVSSEAFADVSDGFSRDLDPRCNPPTHIFCVAGCNDPETSNLHCGRCGNACVAPETCFMGRCARP